MPMFVVSMDLEGNIQRYTVGGDVMTICRGNNNIVVYAYLSNSTLNIGIVDIITGELKYASMSVYGVSHLLDISCICGGKYMKLFILDFSKIIYALVNIETGAVIDSHIYDIPSLDVSPSSLFRYLCEDNLVTIYSYGEQTLDGSTTYVCIDIYHILSGERNSKCVDYSYDIFRDILYLYIAMNGYIYLAGRKYQFDIIKFFDDVYACGEVSGCRTRVFRGGGE